MNILLGITGGIAAYKSCELTRLLVKAGHQVKVVMTQAGQQFIHPNSFAALSQHPVYHDLSEENDAMLHISLAKWAECIIIAPASASTLAKLAHGIADNLLSTLMLASEASCFIAPAMNQAMWHKPVTQNNIAILSQYYQLIMPTAGEQACGDVGIGRMAEPETIVEAVLGNSQLLKDINIIITAGPTQEKIDPVRYLSNFSSGKMGYALAQAAATLGANVHLISGPTALTTPVGVSRTDVVSTQQMLDAVLNSIDNCQIFIAAAAVADYTPVQVHSNKIKKSQSPIQLTLDKTPDILRQVSQHHPELMCVGFCAETTDLLNAAKQKRVDKNIHAIIANSVSTEGYPFNADSNEVYYISEQQTQHFSRENKSSLAKKLLLTIQQDFQKKSFK